ncbi:DKNYY domain-containing protein [Ralstonia flaminis]|jgi:hypothetical protein|uniref:Uncharacterized protein n=1 Tax=Ralstonia flaminis TaxID=3058597 RepID=A0ABN9JPW7_9RALS|nr:DKNYY domain-containing protein [Ralstonia sp. LMG 18101]CAJ0820427.1 hypothetical protein LMG18101_04277 [Ralstonia sp. LMG 18101]
MRRARLAGLLAVAATLLSLPAAGLAYTVRSCTEYWYPPAKPGQSISDLRPERTNACKHHAIEMRSDRFGVIDGQGYFITTDVNTSRACAGGGPAFNPSCLIPGPLQRNEVSEVRNYYRLTQNGASLRPLGQGYATDGRMVFSYTSPIAGADAASFQVFTPQGAAADAAWARDRTRIYHDETPVPGMAPGPVTVFDETFAVNGGRVYEIDALDGIKLRPDVRPSLTVLAFAQPLYSNVISDGQHIYVKGKPLDGARAATFQMLPSTCPVPGLPGLKCRSELVRNTTASNFRIARSGNDILYFGEVYKVVRIRNAPDFVYFQLADSDELLGIGGNRVFQLEEMGSAVGDTVVDRTYVGRLNGPAAGYLVDEIGFISLHDLARGSGPLCGQVSDLATPERDGVPRFGPLKRLPEAQVPAGFKIAFENTRYRYLFAGAQSTEFDTVIDLRDGRRMRANWCGDGIQPQVARR